MGGRGRHGGVRRVPAAARFARVRASWLPAQQHREPGAGGGPTHPGDLVELIRTARDRGMRVIADLVVNHTSDQHPWFQSARSDRDSPYRDFYVWSDAPPDDSPAPTFPDQETSVWTFDDQAGQYYLHRFYRHQPDLNVTNPKVRDEIVKMMGFWLELVMSGFRVDAVPFLLETLGVDVAESDSLPDPHTYLRELRADSAVLALQTSWDDASVVTVHNYADLPAEVRIRPHSA